MGFGAKKTPFSTGKHGPFIGTERHRYTVQTFLWQDTDYSERKALGFRQQLGKERNMHTALYRGPDRAEPGSACALRRDCTSGARAGSTDTPLQLRDSPVADSRQCDPGPLPEPHG